MEPSPSFGSRTTLEGRSLGTSRLRVSTAARHVTNQILVLYELWWVGSLLVSGQEALRVPHVSKELILSAPCFCLARELLWGA